MDNVTKWYNSKYDCYGNLLGVSQEKIDYILVGDLVEFSYADTALVIENGRPPRSKKITITSQGIWDGEKVCLNDKKETIVRTKAWLNLLNKEK